MELSATESTDPCTNSEWTKECRRPKSIGIELSKMRQSFRGYDNEFKIDIAGIYARIRADGVGAAGLLCDGPDPCGPSESEGEIYFYYENQS